LILAELRRALARSRHKAPVALAIVEFSDIRSFEMSGEAVLRKRLGELLQAWTPSALMVGHLREREYALIFRNVALPQIQHLAGEIPERVRREPALQGQQRGIVTIVGVGFSSRSDCGASTLMSFADIALHYARSSGRGWHAIVDVASPSRAA
jgi:GGDEF domain-containing protein